MSICIECGREVRKPTKSGLDFSRGMDMSMIDPQRFFCTMRCAARFGAKAASKARSRAGTYGQAAEPSATNVPEQELHSGRNLREP